MSDQKKETSADKRLYSITGTVRSASHSRLLSCSVVAATPEEAIAEAKRRSAWRFVRDAMASPIVGFLESPSSHNTGNNSK